MRIAIALIAMATAALPAMSQTYTRGYVRSNGTYVEPHYSSRPNDTKLDNYSTKGNVNPYTGQEGTVNPYAPKPAYSAQPCYGYNCPR